MSQYSLMLGSFERTGNYPIEANYIFLTVDALRDFYSKEINNAILHKGLLKIVEDNGEGKQALFWVTKKQTSDELEFTLLIVADSISEILDSIDDLNQRLLEEIEARKLADDAIWGTLEPELIDDELNSILKLSLAIIAFRLEFAEFKLQTENALDNLLTICKAIAGSEVDDVVNYLEHLPYKNITEIARLLDHFFNEDTEDESINTWPELEFFLKDYKDTDTLLQVLTKLEDDLWNRIEGDPLPNEPFRTLRGTLDFIENLASFTKNRIDNLQTELDQTQVGVGLSGDGAYNADQETYYLKNATSVMNALKILDSLINLAINNCNLEVEDTSTVDLKIDKYSLRTVLSANVLVSGSNGNDIIIKNDGIYHNVRSEYLNGVLTLKVNDTIVSQHILGLSYIGVEQAYYEPTTESIVLKFKKEDGSIEELRIPVTLLIREWVTDNTGVSDVVVLTRVEDYSGGPDKLSADVRILADKYNILNKQGNTLYVRGTADNIVWNDVKVSIILDNLEADMRELRQVVTNNLAEIYEVTNNLQQLLDREIIRARLAELELNTSFEASQAVLDEKINALQLQANNNSTAIQNVKNELEEEIVRATTEEVKNHELIVRELSRAEIREAQLEDALSSLRNNLSNVSEQLINEVNRSTEIDNLTILDLRDEILRAKTRENEIAAALNGEINRAQNVENTINDNLFHVNNELVRVTDIATRAEANLVDFDARLTAVDSKIDSETVRAEALEAILAHSIQDERLRAMIVELSLRERLTGYDGDIEDLKLRMAIAENKIEIAENNIQDLYNTKADKSMLEWLNG